MKRTQNSTSSAKTQCAVVPTGVTLSEVLVSMLIMSVGVVSLATLFPISVIRTAQATQLTHAVFTRNNAEAAVESNLGLLSNAQIYGFSGLGVIDPLGVQLVGTLTVSSLGVGVGTPVGVVRRTDGLASSSITPAQRLALAEQLATLPDSWSLVREEAVTATDLTPTPPAYPTITVGNSTIGLNVRNGQYASNARHRMVMFDAGGKLAVLQPLYQVQQVSPYNLSWWNVNGSGTPLTTGPYLPTGFMPTRVRIEAQDRRYTWMMTARKRWTPVGPVSGADGGAGVSGTDDDGNGTIDDPDGSELHYTGSDDDPNWAAELHVAVFYNRSFRAADEVLHGLTVTPNGLDGQPGVSGVNDDNDVNAMGVPIIDEPDETGWPGSDDNRTVTVSLASQPYLKKGGFMLEPTQLKWYRILNIDLTSSAGNAVLLLDQDVRNPVGGTITQGIFMRGIVEVFSLGSRTGQQ